MPIFFVRNFLKCQFKSYNQLCFPFNTILMTLYKDTLPYFNQYIHVYNWNLSILWSTLKKWISQNFTIANFGHPVPKYWLRHCFVPIFVITGMYSDPHLVILNLSFQYKVTWSTPVLCVIGWKACLLWPHLSNLRIIQNSGLPVPNHARAPINQRRLY